MLIRCETKKLTVKMLRRRKCQKLETTQKRTQTEEHELNDTLSFRVEHLQSFNLPLQSFLWFSISSRRGTGLNNNLVKETNNTVTERLFKCDHSACLLEKVFGRKFKTAAVAYYQPNKLFFTKMKIKNWKKILLLHKFTFYYSKQELNCI